MGIREQLLAAVDDSPLSDRKISMRATATPDTIRNIRRGAAPRADTLEAICQVLGLDLQIGPRPQTEPGALPSRPPTRFTNKVTLPVRRWADYSVGGYLLRPDDSDRAPAPEDLSDQHAFYAQVPGPCMVPGGISPDDYCLVFPFAQLEVDQRAWFLRRTGEEAIKWVMRLPSEALDLGAWEFDSLGHAKLVPDRWERGDVADRGVVVDVYHDRPSVERPLPPAPRWRPDALSELRRSALFSSNNDLEAAAAELDTTVSAVGQIEVQMKLLAARAPLTASQRELLLRVVEERLEYALIRIRETVAAIPVGGDRAPPEEADD